MRLSLREHGIYLALVALFMACTIWLKNDFVNPENLRNILSQNAEIGICAIGMTIVIIAGGIDLSIGAMVALIGYLGVQFMINRASSPAGMWMGIGVMILAGLVLGLINGALVVFGRLAPFVATLAGFAGFRSVATALSEAKNVNVPGPFSDSFTGFARGGIPIPGVKVGNGAMPLLIQWPFLVFVALSLVAWFILERTTLGRKLVAVGANEQAARYSGLSVGNVRLFSYLFMGLCAAIATLFETAKLSSISAGTFGSLRELDAIAAVVIGGTALSGGRGTILGTFVGVLILGVINNALTLSSIDSNWQGAVKGVIILLAVLLQRGKAAR